MPEDLVGTELGGRYRIREPLAQGGMGAVFLGVDEHTGDDVAIKVLRGELVRSEEALARFRREVRALSSIDSPHIVTAHDAGRVNGMPYLVMERLRGMGLDEITAAGAMAPRRAIDIVSQLLAGLADAHAAGVIHRDLKPSNIWLTGDNRVKILDFGVAKMAGATKDLGEEGGKLTGTGAVLGSPAYMSPEQLISSKEADERADVWSVGVVLYELLTGSMLFSAETVGAIFANVIRMPIPALREVVPGASPELERVMGHCLERDPELRIASAQALADALATVREAGAGGEHAFDRVETDVTGGRVAPRTLSDVPTVLLPRTPTAERTARTGGTLAAGAILLALVALVAVVAIVVSRDASPDMRPTTPSKEMAPSSVTIEAPPREDGGSEPAAVAAAPSAPPATTSTGSRASAKPALPPPPSPRTAAPVPAPSVAGPKDELWEETRH